MKNDNEKTRNQYIDFLKGLCIFLVVLGHCDTTDKTTFWFIYIFHIPLFFCISGYLFKPKTNFKSFIKSKVKTLIIPYIIFFVITCIIQNLLIKPIKFNTLIKYFFLNGFYLSSINNISLWYLPLFFIASITFYFIMKIPNKKFLILITLISGLLTVPTYQFLKLFTPPRLIPFSIQVLPAAIFYLGIGQLFKQNYDIIISRIKFSPITKFYSFCLFAIGLIISIDVTSQIISIASYKYLISSLLIIQFIILITRNNNNKLLIYLGKNVLIILGLHKILLEVLEKHKIYRFLAKFHITSTFASIFVSIGCISFLCIINIIYKYLRIKCRNYLNEKNK